MNDDKIELKELKKEEKAEDKGTSKDQNQKPPKVFRFVYIDPASMTHGFFLEKKPKAGDEVFAYNAQGERLEGINKIGDLRIENVVPLK